MGATRRTWSSLYLNSRDSTHCRPPRASWPPPPHPLPRRRVCYYHHPNPGTKGGGGTHSPAIEGAGSPNSDDWRKSLALCLLCSTHDFLSVFRTSPLYPTPTYFDDFSAKCLKSYDVTNILIILISVSSDSQTGLQPYRLTQTGRRRYSRHELEF